ncbi:hypothetical protein MKY34_06035 [Sporosarcina sp. FSL K6-1522]|uniref:hypothetical protein n=1 Tax=Sporosarcina sp. FSL K6-1522 TaxID=2921554 RepID=UPI003159E4E1
MYDLIQRKSFIFISGGMNVEYTFIQWGFTPPAESSHSFRRMSRIFKGAFSSVLEEIWTQLRLGVIDGSKVVIEERENRGKSNEEESVDLGLKCCWRFSDRHNGLFCDER